MHFVSLVLAATATAGAQVPDGSYVVSTFGWPTRPGGGVWIVDPRTPGPPTAVTGLGTDLLGVPGTTQGANCIEVRPDDRALLVGEIANTAGAQIELHEIFISGSAAVVDNKIPIGVLARPRGGVNSVALLPNGDALIAVDGLQSTPPLNGAQAAIVQRNGTVIPVPLTGTITGIASGITADRTGTTGYIAILPSGSPISNIYSFALPRGGAATQVGTLRGGNALAVDGAGRLLSTSISPVAIVSLDPATGVQTVVGSTGTNPNGVNLEAATDSAVYVLNGLGSNGLEVGWIDQNGVAQGLTNQLTGVGSGIAVLDDPRTYGASTPGTFDYGWQAAPSLGGLPRVGNAGFGLHVMATTGGSPAGFLLAATRGGSSTVFGVNLLLNQAAIIPLQPVPPNGMVPVPIPAHAPVGLDLFFQSFHLDTGAPLGLAASDGLRLTLLQ